MKLSRRTYITWWDVHAWGGVAIGLVLAMMFLGGTVSVFRHDLEVWQDAPAQPISRAAADAAIPGLVPAAHAGKAVGVSVASHRVVRPMIWLPDAQQPVFVDPAVPGAGYARTSRVADVFFHLHFLWHDALPIGMFVAGLFGIGFLLLVVTGVAIHLKDFGRQLYQFRPLERARTLWSDLHKVLGVWGLPFQVLLALTGALICVMSVLAPHVGRAAFEGNRGAAEAELWGAPELPKPPSGLRTPALGFHDLASRAERALPGMRAGFVSIAPWGDAAAVATVYGDRPGHGVWPEVKVVLRAGDGTVTAIDAGGEESVTHDVVHALYGLHFGSYGGWPIRACYVVLGLAGWITILSGNWIWIARRRARGKGRGAELLARLTIGIGGGMLPAGALLLCVNRLAAPTAARVDLEVYGFFAAWAAVTLACLALPGTRRTWAGVVGLAGAALAAVPVLSLITGAGITGVEIGAAIAGGLCVGAAAILRRGGAA